VDVAKSILSELRIKVSGVRLPSMPEKIRRELEGFQLTIEVLKSRGFSGSSYCLGDVASFVWMGGIFTSWCCIWKLDVGVDL
jgi:hypothetical protein